MVPIIYYKKGDEEVSIKTLKSQEIQHYMAYVSPSC